MGNFSLSLRKIFVPFFLFYRKERKKEEEEEKKELVDTLLLTAFILSKPNEKKTKKEEVENFDQIKKKFLEEENFCSIKESERVRNKQTKKERKKERIIS